MMSLCAAETVRLLLATCSLGTAWNEVLQVSRSVY